MGILESGENYLESIYKLSLTQSEIHAIDIVNDLGFSKPSVSIALKKLKEDGYIEIDEKSHLHLTNSGEKIAIKVYERHVMLTNIFMKLGISKEIAEEDACRIEHDLHDETFEAIKNYITKL